MAKVNITIQIDSEDLDMLKETLKEDYDVDVTDAGVFHFIISDWLTDKTGTMEFDDYDAMVDYRSWREDEDQEELDDARLMAGDSNGGK